MLIRWNWFYARWERFEMVPSRTSTNLLVRLLAYWYPQTRRTITVALPTGCNNEPTWESVMVRYPVDVAHKPA